MACASVREEEWLHPGKKTLERGCYERENACVPVVTVAWMVLVRMLGASPER